jgi:hypothetical protein
MGCDHIERGLPHRHLRRQRRRLRQRRPLSDLHPPQTTRRPPPSPARLRRHLAQRPQTFDLEPGKVDVVFVSHLHGDHFAGLAFLILDGQFSRRTQPLTIAGPPSTARRLTGCVQANGLGNQST